MNSQTKDRPRSRLGWIVRIAVVVGILTVGLVYFVDLPQMGALLAAASLPLVLLAFLTAVLDHVVMGLKWGLLLRTFHIRVPWHVPIGAYFRGQVFLLFVPSTLGIDVYRAYDLKRRGAPLVGSLSSIFVERFVGMLSSLAIIGLLLPFALKGFSLPHGGYAATAGWLGFLGITVFLHACLHYADRLAHFRILRMLPNKIERLTRNFLRTVGAVRDHRRDIYLYYGFSIVEKIFYGAVVFLAARAIGLDQVSFLHCISAIPLIALLERLPISISALGVREGLFVALLQPYGIEVTQAVTVALIVRAVELARVAFGMPFWLGREAPREELQKDLRIVEERIVASAEDSVA